MPRAIMPWGLWGSSSLCLSYGMSCSLWAGAMQPDISRSKYLLWIFPAASAGHNRHAGFSGLIFQLCLALGCCWCHEMVSALLSFNHHPPCFHFIACLYMLNFSSVPGTSGSSQAVPVNQARAPHPCDAWKNWSASHLRVENFQTTFLLAFLSLEGGQDVPSVGQSTGDPL